MHKPSDREAAEAVALEYGKQQWERKLMQRRIEKATANTLAKYRPPRSSKHPAGATKPTIDAKKAKNRAKRKASRRNRR